MVDVALPFMRTSRRQRRTLGEGLLAQTRGDYAEAMRCYIEAAERDPNDAHALYFAALTAFQLRQKDHAIRLMWGSIHRFPQHPEAWYNLGKFYQDKRELGRALECYIAALEYRADMGQALVNAGNIFWELGDEISAEACYERALHTSEGGHEAVYNLSFLLHLKGDWPRAFDAAESRWGCPAYVNEYKKDFMDLLPRWNGELATGRLLVHGEQGAGDIFQMLRYIPLVQKRVTEVTLGVFDSMVRLCQQSFPGVQVVAAGDPIGDCGAQIPSISLPRILGTSWDNPPPRCPYLKADATLAPSTNYRIGLCWAGSPTHPRDDVRSMKFEDLKPLLLPDVEWINLQVGPHAKDWAPSDALGVTAEELAHFHKHVAAVRKQQGHEDYHPGITSSVPPPIATARSTEEGGDYLDTAGLVQSCDLVITCDTSIAHLAGALGKEVWVLCSRFPDVRWMLNRADTPWYHTMQIFRQTIAGDWAGLVNIVRQLLELKIQFKERGL